MLPRFREGDLVLIARYWFSKPAVNQVVVARHGEHGLILKKIAQIDGDQISLEGTGHASSDSISLGKISRSSILGRVIFGGSGPAG